MVETLPKLPPIRGAVRNSYGKDDPRLAKATAWYNDLAARFDLPRVVKLTQTRARHVFARMAEEEFDLDAIARQIAASKFLRGKNARGWVVSFDFIFCSANNYLKILEGRYNDTKQFTSGARETVDADTVRRVVDLARSSETGRTRVA